MRANTRRWMSWLEVCATLCMAVSVGVAMLGMASWRRYELSYRIPVNVYSLWFMLIGFGLWFISPAAKSAIGQHICITSWTLPLAITTVTVALSAVAVYGTFAGAPLWPTEMAFMVWLALIAQCAMTFGACAAATGRAKCPSLHMRLSSIAIGLSLLALVTGTFGLLLLIVRLS